MATLAPDHPSPWTPSWNSFPQALGQRLTICEENLSGRVEFMPVGGRDKGNLQISGKGIKRRKEAGGYK